MTLGQRHADGVAGAEAAVEDFLRQRILDPALDRALERPRPIDGIEACAGDIGERGVGYLEMTGYDRPLQFGKLM